MRLAVSPRLQPADIEALNKSVGTEFQNSLLSDRLAQSFDLSDLEAQISKNHVRALCWMLANGSLDMRVVVPAPEAGVDAGIYHQKIGILSDEDGDVLSFSGSINETAKGWLGNIEQFKVFRSGVDVESEYVDDDVRTFSRYWDGTSGATRTVELPDAVRESLLSYAPEDVESLGLETVRETTRAGARARGRSSCSDRIRTTQSRLGSRQTVMAFSRWRLVPKDADGAVCRRTAEWRVRSLC